MVLTSAAVVERVAPFSPARPGHPKRAGLKGATLCGNPDDVSTAANEVSEERSESRDRREWGLSRCSKKSIQQACYTNYHLTGPRPE
ncbi:hypothetical protein BRC95_03610 [Halobacteriales archaeon QS_5_68_33]|nr:MAG: hypothetical protein BRC95_03610 [Halobacteriales archaeon QS_5_68_33]